MSDEDLNRQQKATQRDLDELHKKFDEHYSDRMDRMESKLNQLTDAVVSLARAEEKISVLIQDMTEIKHAVNSHTNRIHQLEIDVSRNSSNLTTLSKFFWTAVGAGVSVVVAAILSGILV